MTKFIPNRRAVLAGMAATLATPALLRAADGPVKLATLTPMTGAGGSYGASMRDVMLGVVKEVNAAGGVLGREIEVVSDDTQTSPEAAVRAARKLIDVDGVAAIMGTWASSVTTAVAPLAWEGKTMLLCTSGSDSITQLPHQGYVVRTQPGSILQTTTSATDLSKTGPKSVFWMGPQSPFAETSIKINKEIFEKGGAKFSSLIYEADKSTYRSEVDTALREKPDLIVFGGYATDSTILLRDLWQAGYEGRISAQAYAVNAGVIDSLPAEVTNGVITTAPAPARGSAAYANASKILGVEAADPYSAQCYDHVNLVLLAMAKAGVATGEGVRDHLRDISQGDGTKVSSALEGLPLIAGGVNYEGASGSCTFNEKGDIQEMTMLYAEIKDKKPVSIDL
ncbi:MAG: ABC transporter substrate-binding protein [Alphaproteobacteria bacterium]|nr:ABC transporter substrate-binding protein [Alphaproteobacteria bacterium]